MTVKKDNSSGTGPPGDAAMAKHCSKPTKPSRGPELSTSQGYAHHGVTSSRNMPSQAPAGQGMYYDQVQVQQWAATSATGAAPFEDFSGQEGYNAGYACAPAMARTKSQHPGHFPMSCSPVTPDALKYSTQDLGTSSGMGYNNFHPCNTGAPGGLGTDLSIQEAQSYGNSVDYTTLQCNFDAWSYPTPPTDDMVYTNHMAIPETVLEGQNTGNCFQPAWSQISYPNGDASLNTGVAFASHPVSGSPLSTIDPSVTSSYSQNSIPGPEPDTPLSQAMQEGTWSSDQDNGCFHGLGLGESAPFFALSDVVENGDGPSTVKANQQFHRTPLSSMWPQGEATHQVYMDQKYPGAAFQRRSSDGEPTTAREHPHYQVGPATDGLYHCPFAKTEGCSHRAEKLKCNYDKHLDSHLKPYRCKVPGCVELQFSSTACLLRHEREAHGMHGHGEKPHLCFFTECDRSVHGNGFPRRWNLFDHMKRVHDYKGTASSSASNSPSPSSAGSCHQGFATLAIRKRRPSSPIQVEPPKRTMSATGTKIPPPKAIKVPAVTMSQGKRQSMQKMWLEQKAAIKARFDSLGPNDAGAAEQLNADCNILHTIGMSIRREEAGQLASA